MHTCAPAAPAKTRGWKFYIRGRSSERHALCHERSSGTAQCGLWLDDGIEVVVVRSSRDALSPLQLREKSGVAIGEHFPELGERSCRACEEEEKRGGELAHRSADVRGPSGPIGRNSRHMARVARKLPPAGSAGRGMRRVVELAPARVHRPQVPRAHDRPPAFSAMPAAAKRVRHHVGCRRRQGPD